MLSSALISEAAIDINIKIIRVFIAIRKLITLPETASRIKHVEDEISVLKAELNEILSEQDEINEDTRAQLDSISLALSELQAKEPEKQKRKTILFSPKKLARIKKREINQNKSCLQRFSSIMRSFQVKDIFFNNKKKINVSIVLLEIMLYICSVRMNIKFLFAQILQSN